MVELPSLYWFLSWTYVSLSVLYGMIFFIHGSIIISHGPRLWSRVFIYLQSIVFFYRWVWVGQQSPYSSFFSFTPKPIFVELVPLVTLNDSNFLVLKMGTMGQLTLHVRVLFYTSTERHVSLCSKFLILSQIRFWSLLWKLWHIF